ncbi:GDSL-type esterase/lipase family protein [Parabacteroides sp. FAFU027]|uniref:GDSL-type esterase/lipase family protein n=1 Tax=Parabacteroides sp. FAFU027 TaxID=2922715 RepID=UPI001FAF8060|nr:GDSL-type esterase/lipase family protein [Parabacteroides sp. FAFU027]
MRKIFYFLICMMLGFVQLNAQTLQQKFYVDFGPNDVTNGNITTSPDVNGNYWNNLTDNTVAGNIAIVNSTNAATGFRLLVTKAMSKNGILSGGLTAPGTTLLGEYAIATATQDYFFTTNASTPGAFKLTGLNPSKAYKFYIFGSRNTTEPRIAKYTLTGINSAIGNLQTSGTNLGGTGYNGNNSTVYASDLIYPNASGEITLDLAVSSGTYAHINLMKVEEYTAGQIDATSITISGNNISSTGATSQMSAQITPSNATVKTVSWKVDDETVAYIDANGLLYPKKNGAVTVTATLTQTSSTITVTKQITISNQLAALYFSGSNTENGDNIGSAIPMKMVTGFNGIVTPVFEIYTSLKSDGTFNFYTSQDQSATVFGAGATSGTIQAGGAGIDPAESGPVLITVNLSTNTYTILPITKWSVVGSTIVSGWGGDVPLTYQGNGVWSGLVDMTVTTTETPRFVLRANGNWSYVLKRVQGTSHTVRMESQASANGYTVEDIPLGYGLVNVTVDLRNYTYSVACPSIDNYRIAWMGSSVANGQGATNMQGYRYLYTQELAQRFADNKGYNWSVGNISVNGNSTLNLLSRWESDLTPQCSKYVVYALSLGNEGIHEATDKQAIFNQFKTNMQTLIDMARASGKYPLVTNNYTRADFDLTDYSYIRQMNMLIHEWDVPSVNMLGAIDDGTGKWPVGYQSDVYHPNDAGHAEFSYAIVPSLFDAIQNGKSLPQKVSGTYLTLGKSVSTDRLTFIPENLIHPFTISFDVRTTGTGIISSFDQAGQTGSLTITDAGVLQYSSPNGGIITGTTVVNDGQWHKVTLTHFYARGETLLYSDAMESGRLSEKLLADKFSLNDVNAPAVIDYRELFFYRSGMNSDELTGLNSGKMLKSSLEIYAPLDGQAVLGTNALVNQAQSTNTVQRVQQVTTGVSENTTTGRIRISPNPAQNEVTIDGLTSDRPYDYSVYKLDGQIVLNGQLSDKKEINITSLSPMQYVLVIKGVGNSISQGFKFTKADTIK